MDIGPIEHMLPVLVLSTLDWLCVIAIMIGLFRIDYEDNRGQALFVAVQMAAFSYVVQASEAGGYLIGLEMLLFVVSVWLFFQIHWMYAVATGLICYHGWRSLLSALVWGISLAGVPKGNIFAPLAPGAIAAHGLAYLVVAGAVYWIYRKRFWFTFVRETRSQWPKLSDKSNLAMLLTAGADVLLFNRIGLLPDALGRPVWFLLSCVFGLLVIALLTYYCFVMEQKSIRVSFAAIRKETADS